MRGVRDGWGRSEPVQGEECTGGRGKHARAGKGARACVEGVRMGGEGGSDGLCHSLCRGKCACGRGRDGIGESLSSLSSHPTLVS